jgi:hypothetical protein
MGIAGSSAYDPALGSLLTVVPAGANKLRANRTSPNPGQSSKHLEFLRLLEIGKQHS